MDAKFDSKTMNTSLNFNPMPAFKNELIPNATIYCFSFCICYHLFIYRVNVLAGPCVEVFSPFPLQKMSDLKIRFQELEREICKLRSKRTGMTRGGKSDLSSGSGEAILQQPFTVNNNNNDALFNGVFLF